MSTSLMKQPLQVRFWARVARGDGCWEWTGYRGRSGYGAIPRGGKIQRAHRVSWELHNGPIPAGLHVLHCCDNRACVRPDHLFLGTHADNMRDRLTKGRMGDTGSPGSKNPGATFTDADVVAIRARRAAGESGQALAAAFGVNKSTISKVVLRRRWAHVA